MILPWIRHPWTYWDTCKMLGAACLGVSGVALKNVAEIHLTTTKHEPWTQIIGCRVCMLFVITWLSMCCFAYIILQIVFVCLYITPSHYHHCANFIWRHSTYKITVRYNLSNVWVRLSIFSQSSIIQYVGLCVFSLPIPFVTIVRIYILWLIIIIKSEVWTITHCLGLGHETMVCAVHLSIFL